MPFWVGVVTGIAASGDSVQQARNWGSACSVRALSDPPTEDARPKKDRGLGIRLGRSPHTGAGWRLGSCCHVEFPTTVTVSLPG